MRIFLACCLDGAFVERRTAYDSEFSSCLVESTFLINSAYSVGGIIGAMSNTSVTDAMSSGVIDMTEVKTECSMVGGLVGEIKAGSLDKEKEPVLSGRRYRFFR